MAISRRTLLLVRQLRADVGAEADDATRAIAAAWVRAWDELSAQMRAAVSDLVAQAVADGAWPAPWRMARIATLGQALTAAERSLASLGGQAGITVSDAAGRLMPESANRQPQILASQLPAAEQPSGLARFNARLLPSALDAMVARTQAGIVGATRPLSADATEAMRRALISGVATGDGPRAAAADMLRRVEGAFNGGLTRALTIARTELLDGYRTASAYAHAANSDVLDGWEWLSARDRRTCPSCWAMDGQTFPLSQPGPWDHPNGRCARMPVLRPWSALGIQTAEPARAQQSAQAAFNALPNAAQLQVMGPARLDALNSGRATWSQLATQRPSSQWRPSYQPTPVRDLVRR